MLLVCYLSYYFLIRLIKYHERPILLTRLAKKNHNTPPYNLIEGFIGAGLKCICKRWPIRNRGDAYKYRHPGMTLCTTTLPSGPDAKSNKFLTTYSRAKSWRSSFPDDSTEMNYFPDFRRLHRDIPGGLWSRAYAAPWRYGVGAGISTRGCRALRQSMYKQCTVRNRHSEHGSKEITPIKISSLLLSRSASSSHYRHCLTVLHYSCHVISY